MKWKWKGNVVKKIKVLLLIVKVVLNEGGNVFCS